MIKAPGGPTISAGVFKRATYYFPIAAAPKERQRSSLIINKKTGVVKPVHYTPEDTKLFQQGIREIAAIQHKSLKPYESWLVAWINYNFKTEEYFGYGKNNYKGDLDNMEKALLDGMEGAAFKNDYQIKETHHSFIYDEERNDCIEVILTPYFRRTWETRLSPDKFIELAGL